MSFKKQNIDTVNELFPFTKFSNTNNYGFIQSEDKKLKHIIDMFSIDLNKTYLS